MGKQEETRKTELAARNAEFRALQAQHETVSRIPLKLCVMIFLMTVKIKTIFVLDS